MPRVTPLDKAIAEMERDVAILQAAIVRLKQQQARVVPRKPRSVMKAEKSA